MFEPVMCACDVCGGMREMTDTDRIPDCCGQRMKKIKPLEHCRVSETPEHVRFEQDPEPCDDGRGRIE